MALLVFLAALGGYRSAPLSPLQRASLSPSPSLALHWRWSWLYLFLWLSLWLWLSLLLSLLLSLWLSLNPRASLPRRCRIGPLQGKLSLSLRDQTALNNPGNEATLELKRSFSVGGDKLSALLLKYTPRFDRDGKDKIELTASAAVRAAEDVVLSAEATIKSPDNAFEAKAGAKTKGYQFSIEHNSRDTAPISLLEVSKSIMLAGVACKLNAHSQGSALVLDDLWLYVHWFLSPPQTALGVKLSPDVTVLAKSEVQVTPQIKLTPVISCRASDMKPSVIKVI
ncbi:hypothetical protein T492DRAFT_834692 [Pavlovales sp. CCMP2436]|nr:hypothetical protein T492DRAFT_834692 [Pavlovales sp. CCMP2436]